MQNRSINLYGGETRTVSLAGLNAKGEWARFRVVDPPVAPYDS